MKKPAKIGLWLLGLAVLGVLGLWLEHERAKARLAAFKADLIAKGEKLAIADHVPKLPPALSNAAPDFIAAANRLTELKPEWQPSRMRMVAPGKARVAWRQPELPSEKEPDLWPFIIAHVEENRPLLAEMATALERSELVFNLDYTKGFNLLLPHLVAEAAEIVAVAGRRAVVIGRSAVVGRPVAQLLRLAGALVEVVHTGTPDMGEVTRRAEILVVAAGVRGLVRGEHVARGAVVIDVGIHAVGEEIYGDVDEESVAAALGPDGALSPVPGGVGPLTNAILVLQAARAAERRAGA